VKPDLSNLLTKAQRLDLSGNASEASVAYREFLELNPENSGVWADYAGQLLKLGDLDAALLACETALRIDPTQTPALINLGVLFMRRERYKEAENQFRGVLALAPHRMDAVLFLAECLLNLKDLKNARKALEIANCPDALSGHYSTLIPHHADLLAILSSALFEGRRFDEAEEVCHLVLQLDPEHLTAISNLGSIRMAQGRLTEAETIFRSLVAKHPSDDPSRLLLVTLLVRKGDLLEANKEIETALTLRPRSEYVHKNLVGTFYNCGHWDEFKAEVSRFQKIDPSSALPEWEQSLVDLLHANMAEGWARYEARLRLPPESMPKDRFLEPAWTGTPFPNQTLLLWAEQGLGDTLMFLRYLPLVKALGGSVILEVPAALLDLAVTCGGADVLVSKGKPLPAFDLQLPLMSLPLAFRTTLSTVPKQIPYLDVPETVPNPEAIRECLAMDQGSSRSGLVWAGGPGYVRDFERSLSADAFAPLSVVSDVTWYSFQLGRPELPPLPNLISFAPYLKNFSDTAYALSGMDLVITVDTAVAHLAGALGIPTLLLLSFQPDFRWLLDRDDSPWYPSLRLYRQPAYGDWASVLSQVVSDLTQPS